MNFTKEYIELCKDKKIQKLRSKLYEGDWYFDEKVTRVDIDRVFLFSYSMQIKDKYIIWLPTGDQLDEEIEKIFESRKNYGVYNFISFGDEYGKRLYVGEALGIRLKGEHNPLIAKIKLLLELLKGE
jgi:hypothetical protein